MDLMDDIYKPFTSTILHAFLESSPLVSVSCGCLNALSRCCEIHCVNGKETSITQEMDSLHYILI
jgi:hypothetical protein